MRSVPGDLTTLIGSDNSATEAQRLSLQAEAAAPSKSNQTNKQNSVMADRRLSDIFGESFNRRSSHAETESDTFSIVSFVSGQIENSKDELPGNRVNQSNVSSVVSNNDKVRVLIANLKKDMEEYTLLLMELLDTYKLMVSITPDGIRQRFDLAFKEINVIIQLQLQLNLLVKQTDCDISELAAAFLSQNFTVYKRYTVLVNNIVKDLKAHSTYFNENFADLAIKITVPSRRLNVYVQQLKELVNLFCDDEHQNLQLAITYLERLKNIANTEMTINVIKQCPVELRLAGLIQHVGELFYEGDILAKKTYYLILFDSILIITENKFDYFIYNDHIRSSQLLEVLDVGDRSLTLKVSPNHQSDIRLHKFRGITKADILIWTNIINAWKKSNRTSYENTNVNATLKSQIIQQRDMFYTISIGQISPVLEDSLKLANSKVPAKTKPHGKTLFDEILLIEKDYVGKLDVLLDPESMPPPAILGSILRKIRSFHKRSFLPQLEKAHEKDPTNVIECFIGHLPNLPALYKEFIEVRAALMLSMVDGENVRLYICPFHQLASYITWLYEVSSIPRYHSRMRGHLNVLLNCVEDSRVALLHTAILKCRIDYYKAGNIVHKGLLESKAKCGQVKNGQTYYVILFETMIMFTRLKIPHYEFVQVTWLDQMTLGPQTDCKESFKIQERQSKKELVYELRADTITQKKLWVTAISELLIQFASEIKRKVSTPSK